MLAFGKKNPQEGCRSSGNPAEFFSLNSPFHGGAVVVQGILEPPYLEMQIGVLWMLRVTTAAPSYKTRFCHKKLSLCFSHFPMLLVTQRGRYGEQITAGLTKTSHDYAEAERDIQWSRRVQAGDLSTIRPALDSTLICLFASFWQLAEQQQGASYWPNQYFTLSCLKYWLISLSSL